MTDSPAVTASGEGEWLIFITRLRDRRASSGLSLRHFASAAGMSHSTLIKALDPTFDESFPSWTTTRAILKTSGVTMAFYPEKFWRRQYQKASESWREAVEFHQAALRDDLRDRLVHEISDARRAMPSDYGKYFPDAKQVSSVAEFSQELRRLKYKVGNPTFARLAKMMGFPENTVADLCNGKRRRLNFAIVEGFVVACLAERSISDAEIVMAWMTLLTNLTIQ